MVGFFTLTIRSRSDHSIIRQLFFKNTTLDEGLNEFGLNKSFEDSTARCWLGLNTIPPTQTDTLNTMNVAGNYINSGNDREVSWQNNNEYIRFRNYYHFTPTQNIGGVSLAEIGVGFTTNKLLARTLIKDEVGNPASITWLATEYLDVMYDLHVYPSLIDKNGNLPLGSDTYAYTIRACNIGSSLSSSSAGWRSKIIPRVCYFSSDINLSSKNNYPSSGGFRNSYVVHAYIQNSFEANVDFTFIKANANLPNGLSVFSFSDSTSLFEPVFQIQYVKQGASVPIFQNNIAKTSSNELTLSIKIIWGRH